MIIYAVFDVIAILFVLKEILLRISNFLSNESNCRMVNESTLVSKIDETFVRMFWRIFYRRKSGEIKGFPA